MFKNLNLISLLKDNFSKYSGNSAIVINDISYTYSDVYRYSCRIAAQIPEQSDISSKIGFFSVNSVISYATILASTLSGNTFIPLNKSNSVDQFADILLQIDLDLLVVDSESLELFGKIHHLFLEKTIFLLPETSEFESCDNDERIILRDKFLKTRICDINSKHELKDKVLYILFTSGSTGKSKGVELTVGNLTSFVETNLGFYSLGTKDKVSQTFDLCFDLSIFCVFMSWCSGATLFTLNNIDMLSPISFINRHAITLWFSVPYAINLTSKSDSKANSIRFSLFCGEALTVEQVSKWRDLVTSGSIENLYGPTELTIACSRYVVSGSIQNHNGIVSIGKIYEGLDYILLDAMDKPTDKGELCVAGSQNFKQYVNNHPVIADITINEKNYYRTGDVVSVSDTGNLMFYGRKDTQIKRNGYRIELLYIEYHIKSNPNITDAVCIAKQKDQYSTNIVAYLKANKPTTEKEVIDHLCTKLANYMLPDNVVMIDEDDYPRNSNGKIDKKRLAYMYNIN